MKNWIKRITGVADIEAAVNALEAKRIQEQLELDRLQKERTVAEVATQQALEDAEIAKMNPKERATHKKEPWISVLDVKVNQDNIRNGFFELDWNSYFVKDLIFNGYGTEADPEEEIVDRWFRDIVYQMLSNEGLDTNRGSGYISVIPLDKGKSQVS
jgi:hypothetical protein